ncbi:MAG: hypothetical protein ABIS86_12735 [Streptosporangiaceae bacterium]
MGYPGDNNQPSWHGANASDDNGFDAPATSDPGRPVQGSPWPQEQPSSWDPQPAWMRQPAQGGAQDGSQGGAWPEQQPPAQGGWPDQPAPSGPPGQYEPPAQGGGWPAQPEVPQNPFLNAPAQTQDRGLDHEPRTQQFDGTGSQPSYVPPPYEQPWSQQQQTDHDQWPNETLDGGPNRADLGRGRVPVGRKKSNRTPVLIALGVVGAVLLAVIGFSLMNNDDEKPASPPATAAGGESASAAPKPAQTTVKPAVPTTGKIKNRKTDPRPLTFKEVFTKLKFSSGGVSYVMTARSSDNCTKAVHGVKLLAAMKTGTCTQFLRGTFTTADGKLMGTIGIANLSSSAAAKAAGTAGKAKDAYLVALPAKGATKKIGQGQALGEAQARGHYLLMSWVQLPSGKKIPTGSAVYKAAQAFVQNVIVGSNVSPALHARDETGKPWTPR